jgi:hypothetical protein
MATTPLCPLLAKVKTRTRRIWTYVRDDRPFPRSGAAGGGIFCSPDRAGTHPEGHLAGSLERIPVMFERSRHGERSSCILAG